MSKELLWPALVTVLSAMLYFVFVGLVGRARGKYKVPAPQTSGNPDFERVIRVQLNTLEQLVIFFPSLWLFSLTLSPLIGAGFGALWIIGRIVYAAGYYQAAEKRGTGFAITATATVSLMLGSLIGIVLQLVKGA